MFMAFCQGFCNWDIQIQNASRYFELTLGNGNELDGGEGFVWSTGRRTSHVPPRSAYSFKNRGSEKRSQQVFCYRAGDETRGFDLEERKESAYLKLAYCYSGLHASLVSFTSGFPMSWGLTLGNEWGGSL